MGNGVLPAEAVDLVILQRLQGAAHTDMLFTQRQTLSPYINEARRTEAGRHSLSILGNYGIRPDAWTTLRNKAKSLDLPFDTADEAFVEEAFRQYADNFGPVASEAGDLTSIRTIVPIRSHYEEAVALLDVTPREWEDFATLPLAPVLFEVGRKHSARQRTEGHLTNIHNMEGLIEDTVKPVADQFGQVWNEHRGALATRSMYPVFTPRVHRRSREEGAGALPSAGENTMNKEQAAQTDRESETHHSTYLLGPLGTITEARLKQISAELRAEWDQRAPGEMNAQFEAVAQRLYGSGWRELLLVKTGARDDVS